MGRYRPTVSEEAVIIVSPTAKTILTIIVIRAIFALLKQLKRALLTPRRERVSTAKIKPLPVKEYEDVLTRVEKLTKRVERERGSYLPRGQVCVDLLSGSTATEFIMDAQRKLQVMQRLTATLRVVDKECVDFAKRMDLDPDLMHSQELLEFNRDMAGRVSQVMGNTELFGVTAQGLDYRVRKSNNRQSTVGLPTGAQSGELLMLVLELMRAYSMWPRVDSVTEFFQDSALAITIIGEHAVNDGCHQLLDLVEASIS